MKPITETIQRPSFDTTAFVGRSDETIGRSKEVNLILTKAKKLCDGEEVEKRVTVFSAETALGKTWLLCQIAHELSIGPCPDRMKIYRLDPPDKASITDDFDATKETKRVLAEFAADVWGEKIQEVSLPELSRKVMDVTKERLGRYSLVLFVDAVFEADWNFLELFEEHLLGPLAIIPNVLIVLSGRGRKFPWSTPELRFRADFHDLHPFNLDDTRVQIERLDRPGLAASDSVDVIQEIGQGVPGATVWLVQDNDFLKTQNPETLDAILNHFLESVSAEPDNNRTKIRGYIEALCVLRAFDDDRLSKFIQVYGQATGSSVAGVAVSHGVSVNIQKILVNEALAQYKSEEGAYILDKYLAKLAEEYLRRKNPSLWKLLHTTAIDLYAEWVTKYERTKERWIVEKAYHEGVLASAKTD